MEDKKKYQQEYYLKNKERKNQYYLDNKEKIKENIKGWEKENPNYRKKKFLSLPKDIQDIQRKKWNISKVKNNKVKRELIDNFKKNKSCLKCGDKRDYILDFHHKDPSTKLFNLGDGVKFGKDKIKKEMEKCILICRNCHTEFHYLENLNNITLEQYLK